MDGRGFAEADYCEQLLEGVDHIFTRHRNRREYRFSPFTLQRRDEQQHRNVTARSFMP